MFIENVDIADRVEKRDRNWRIEIFSELERGQNFLVRMHREVILVKDGKLWSTGGTHGERKYVVDKTLAEIAFEQVTLPPEYGGLTLNGAQIAVALEMMSDRFRDPNGGA